MGKKTLNMALFNQNLDNVSVSTEDTIPSCKTIGLSNVVQYVWNHFLTKSVDFDSFALEDVYNAKSQLHAVPDGEYDGDDGPTFIEVNEEGKPIERSVNCWEENHLIEDVIASLYNSSKIVYENDDDFI